MDAGTYDVTLRLGNKTVSARLVSLKSITFTKSLVDWTPIYTKLCGKDWRIDYSKRDIWAAANLVLTALGGGRQLLRTKGQVSDATSVTFSNTGVYTYSPVQTEKLM